MLGGLKKVDFEDLSQVAPVALMLIAMPISGSIGHGIGLGLITYTVLKVFTGKSKGGFYPYLCYFASFPCEVLPCSVVVLKLSDI